MPPDVTTGLVVVVTGGLVVVVVGGLVVVVGDVIWDVPTAGGTVAVVVGGTAVVVVGGTVVDELSLDAGGVLPGTGPGGFALADEPGCSLATVTPMITASRPAAATEARVTRRSRASARARGVQRPLVLLVKAAVAGGGPAGARSSSP